MKKIIEKLETGSVALFINNDDLSKQALIINKNISSYNINITNENNIEFYINNIIKKHLNKIPINNETIEIILVIFKLSIPLLLNSSISSFS